MKGIYVLNTWQGNTRDLLDIELNDGEMLFDVPYFAPDGSTIDYDEALELYGEDALDYEIWDDPSYIHTLIKWAVINETS